MCVTCTGAAPAAPTATAADGAAAAAAAAAAREAQLFFAGPHGFPEHLEQSEAGRISDGGT